MVAAPAARPLAACPRRCRRGVRSRAAHDCRRQQWFDRAWVEFGPAEEFFRDELEHRVSPRAAPVPIPRAHVSPSSCVTQYRGDGPNFDFTADSRIAVDARLPSSNMVRPRRRAHRGRRSFEAVCRRRAREPTSRDDVLPAVADFDLALNAFSIVHFNIRGFLSKVDELDAVLEALGRPSLVALSETFLNESVKDLFLSGYVLVSRRDRKGQCGGGIALFARDDVAPHIVHIGNSLRHEMSWHILHSDQGPIRICVWYRPPHAGEVDSIDCFDAELSDLGVDCAFTVAVGDMNVHNIEWLAHSTHNSVEGRKLCEVACSHGLQQYIREPTRESNLLDLVLSDCGESLSAQVIPGLSDHYGILASIKLSIPESHVVERECFNYTKADWESMRKAFAETRWCDVLPPGLFADECLSPSVIDDGVRRLTMYILEVVKAHVPHRKVRAMKSTHPWLDDVCKRAILEKYRAFGTADFAAKRDACTAILLRAYHEYVGKTREELCSLKPSSKLWWKKANQLMMKASGSCSIPPLRRPDETWARTADEKAELLSSTFASKSELPVLIENEYTPAEVDLDELPDVHVDVLEASVLSVMGKIRESSGTGPDKVAARVLKRCREELSPVIHAICSHIVRSSHWPSLWRLHWIHPIHKRKSQAEPSNFRGVHLTSQLSKVCERVLVDLFRPFFEHGPQQFAYTPGRGHRDALLFNILSWLSALEDGDLIALFCSDVSGAFDRVCKDILCRKIGALPFPRRLAKLLRSWLDDRISNVVVDGSLSVASPLVDSVFQGTVFGPPLWNQHFGDARLAVQKHGFTETVCADDMNAFKRFRSLPECDAIHELEQCQKELHDWGSGNRVCFDPDKESFHIIHRRFHERSEFKILGVIFDNHLLMHKAVRELAIQGGWRLRAILRVRRYFSVNQLVMLFKSQVMSYLEAGCVAFFHAPPTTMDPVDRILLRFLREMGLSTEDALLRFNLAPFESRRHMAALGVLHRRILGILPGPIAEMFPFGGIVRRILPTRLSGSRHSKLLFDPICGNETQLFKRSLFGYVAIYNRLPQKIVDVSSVSAFQKALQDAMKVSLRRGDEDWATIFRFDNRTSDVARFQRCFVG